MDKKEEKKETVKTEEKKKKNTKKTTSAKKDTVKKVVKKEETKKTVKNETKKTEIKETKIPEARAILRYERISSSKVTIVANLVKGMDVDEALNVLKFTNKAGARILYKLLKSAIANAVNNHYMNESKLYIHEIYANGGPTLKRFTAKAKGSGARILKRTSHITIVLRERD